MFTLCVDGRRPLLADPVVVDSLIKLLADAGAKHDCSVPILTFMPDHLHLLTRGESEGRDAWAAICAFDHAVGVHFPDVGFQRGFYDHVIKWFEGWEHEARYVANNSVRAGLAQTPFEWPFTGAGGYDLRDTFGM